jgi:hypothetical protein
MSSCFFGGVRTGEEVEVCLKAFESLLGFLYSLELARLL